MSNDERLQPTELNPELATLDCGTLNFGGDEVFMNTENTIKYFAERMNERGIKPELEVFDKSMIDMALRLHKKGYIKEPMHFDFVMGVNGGITGELRDFVFLRGSIPTEATYTVAGVGRFEFPLATAAIIDGGHVRVGFEDNVFVSKGVLAKSNGELVQKVVRIAKEFGREIATPDEARKILGMKPRQ
jgi:3-keto-5-aminohexanoate cleavage enzyme